MKGIRLAYSLAALAIVSTSRLAGAQLAGKVILTPYTGAYSAQNAFAVSSGNSLFNGSLKQQTGWVNGANVSYWFTDRVALEGGAAFTSSDVKGALTQREPDQPIRHDFLEGSRIWMTSAKLMVQLLPQTSKFNMRLGAGPAVISRSGKAYDADTFGEFSNLTSVGAVFSACTRIPLNDDVGLRVRLENYTYGAEPKYKEWRRSSVTTFDSKSQSDFVFSMGLQLFLK